MSNRTPFVIYQGPWSVLERDFERDIIPMARAEGMALAPWNVLATGRIRTDAQELQRRETGEKGKHALLQHIGEWLIDVVMQVVRSLLWSGSAPSMSARSQRSSRRSRLMLARPASKLVHTASAC